MDKLQHDSIQVAKVVLYIEQHLDQPLPLEVLAAIANYSPFHFQRIFKSIKGETPKQYIIRLRLEDAAHQIVLHPEKSMLEVAIGVGFSSLEAFSRAFKDFFDISPDHFKRTPDAEKISFIQNSKKRGTFLEVQDFSLEMAGELDLEHLKIAIRKSPEIKLVYLQTTMDASEKINEQLQEIQKWAITRELVPEKQMPFGIIRDYPLFTPLEKCRYFACMKVSAIPPVGGLVHFMELPPRLNAEFAVNGSFAEIIPFVTSIVRTWLPKQGYRIVHNPVLQTPLQDLSSVAFEENEFRISVQIQPA